MNGNPTVVPTSATRQQQQLLQGVTTTGFLTCNASGTGPPTTVTTASHVLCHQRLRDSVDQLRGLCQYALQQQQQQHVAFPTVVVESLGRIQNTLTEAIVLLLSPTSSTNDNTATPIPTTTTTTTNAVDLPAHPSNSMHPPRQRKRPRTTGCSTTTTNIATTTKQRVGTKEIPVVVMAIPPKLRKPYKRRAERPLPTLSLPSNGQYQYSKPEAMAILNSLSDSKDRTNVINHWIVTKRIPITTPITIHKYLREFQQNTGKQDWETDPFIIISSSSSTCTIGDAGDDHHEGDRDDHHAIPPPRNGMTYQRQEACHILLPLPPKLRVQVISQWMAHHQIPVKSMSAVERTLKKAATDGIESIPTQWGRWGNDSPTTTTTTAKTTTATTTIHQKEYLPPHPPPQYNNEYTKLEAISILQKMTPTDRNAVLWKWIQNKQIPIRHPNSMIRILRDAQSGKTISTFTSLDWKTSNSSSGGSNTTTTNTTTNTTTIPMAGPGSFSNNYSYCYNILPPPQNGTMYDKWEFIALASRFHSKQRNELIRQWVHQRKIPYTCPLSANAAVIKAIKSNVPTSTSTTTNDATSNTNKEQNEEETKKNKGQQEQEQGATRE